MRPKEVMSNAAIGAGLPAFCGLMQGCAIAASSLTDDGGVGWLGWLYLMLGYLIVLGLLALLIGGIVAAWTVKTVAEDGEDVIDDSVTLTRMAGETVGLLDASDHPIAAPGERKGLNWFFVHLSVGLFSRIAPPAALKWIRLGGSLLAKLVGWTWLKHVAQLVRRTVAGRRDGVDSHTSKPEGRE